MSKANDGTFTTPGATWLPLHRAPFYFFPDFAPSGSAACRELQKLISRLRPDLSTSAHPADDEVVVVCDTVALTISGQRGGFALGPAAPVDDFETVAGLDDPSGRPMIFFQQCDEAQYRAEHRESAKQLTELARTLWRILERRFATAVASGAAELMGRWRDVDNHFGPIAPDQLAYLTASTVEADDELMVESIVTTLAGPNDVKVYSVHVRPHRVQASLKVTTERACHETLLGLIRQSPDVLTRDELLNSVRQQWGRKELSDRAFVAIYKRAVSEANVEAYKKPGPRRKSIQRTS